MRTPARPPIIVIGMHRSGTSMIVSLLEELGLFMGERKDENGEAFFFLGLNDWLLRQSGAAWDHPGPFEYLVSSSALRPLAEDYLRNALKGPRSLGYLGWGRYRHYGAPYNLDIPWGWKDPRGTYTLPLWLDLFPEARVVHIYRHGVDVAGSLKTREEAILSRISERYERLKSLHRVLPKRSGFTGSPRCLTLEGAFSLWEEYTTEAVRQTVGLGERALTLRYEDFLEEPEVSLRSLADFCEVSATGTGISRITAGVRRDRAYAYRRDKDLSAFAGTVEDRLQGLGYQA